METTQKRPLSLTIIAWFLIIFALFGLYGVLTIRSNEVAMKMLEQMHTSLMFQQVWGVINCLVTIVCAYGILKGQPWSRVLYVVWSVIGLVVAFVTSPMKAVIVLSLIILFVIAHFLFSSRANEWFASRGFALKREEG